MATTKAPGIDKQEAVLFAELTRDALSLPHLSDDKRASAKACLMAAEELIVSVDEYGVFSGTVLQGGNFSIAAMMEGANLAKRYQEKRDVFFAAKKVFIKS
jgi:hypothetical protein